MSYSKFKRLREILFFAVAIVCLVSSVSLAHPSAEPGEETIIPNASESILHRLEELQSRLIGGEILIRDIEKDLEAVESESEGGDDSLVANEQGGRLPETSSAPPIMVNMSRYRTQTHTLLKSLEHPSPTILLIKEYTDRGEVYLGLLSFTIPW